VVFVTGDGELTPGASAADAAAGGGVTRVASSAEFDPSDGGVVDLRYPAGMAASHLLVAGLGDTEDAGEMRALGGKIAAMVKKGEVTLLAGALPAEAVADIAFGMALRVYDFDVYKSREDDKDPVEAVIGAADPDAVARLSADRAALAEGVFFTRDLVNEPANILTTDDFAARLAAMGELGLEVEILGEPELEELGMGALLGVGQGSRSETKVVVMKWMGGGDEAPFAFVGKGVVFDTGGISLKPGAGMEEMTMDMGGAGVVSGVMRALALRKAKANVVGLVGLVENMPDGNAQRPGDIVTSMKGDTIEIINTDAEGRLLLADVLWYAQERFNPTGMINLATLTGAMIIALGNENAGYFANDDDLSDALAAAAKTAGEGAWRLPLGPGYDKLIKSRLADMKNTGGRAAGSITAAQFLKRFVKDETPWIHIDIAGVTLAKEPSALYPKGATGWGVRTLDQLIRDKFES
jgi:leucyl aminopeptidase